LPLAEHFYSCQTIRYCEINIAIYGALCVSLKSGLIKKLYSSPLRTESHTKYSVLLRQLVGDQIE